MTINATHAEITEARVAIAVRRIRAIANELERSQASRIMRALNDIDAACLVIDLVHDEVLERRGAP